MRISADFGEAITGVGYQFIDADGLIGARVTAGITNPRTGLYVVDSAVVEAGAIGVYWDSGDGLISAVEVFDSRLDNLDNLDAAVSSRSTYAGGDTAGTTTLLSRITGAVPLASDYTAGRAAKLDFLDVAVSSRMATFVYTAPDNAGITAIKAKTDLLPTDPADASDIAASFSTVNASLSTIAGYLDTEVAAIKAKTDLIPAQPAAVGSAMTLGTDAITAAAVSAAAVTKIQEGLFLAASYTEPDNTTLGRLGGMLELDGLVYRYTANALEQGPAGGGGSGGLTAEQVAQLEEIHAKTALITVDGLTVSSPVTASGNRIIAKAGDTWTIELSALGAITTRSKLWFSVTRRTGDTDADALLFLEETDGLTVVDGEAYEATADGAISVTDGATGALTISIDEAVTGELGAGTGYWAIKTLSSTGAATTLVEGPFVITQRRIAAFA